MDKFTLDTFPDGVLIDELVIGPGRISIALIGLARYEIAIVCIAGRNADVLVWTTEKGTIQTTLNGDCQWAMTRLNHHGNLESLVATDCSMHLEHMDRGHYWLGLEHSSGGTLHINFSTSGYLKTKMVRHVEPETNPRH